MNAVNALLMNHPAMGVKVLEKPFVLVIKSNIGTDVIYQNCHVQNTASVGSSIFGEGAGIECVFDVEITSHRHILALTICSHDADGNPTEKKFLTIGEKGPQDQYVTAFLAYEAEGGKAVYCINIIEEPENKPLFTAAIRYGKSSERLLKTQMRMFLALSGLNGEDREKIVSGGGLLPPPINLPMKSEKGGDYDD